MQAVIQEIAPARERPWPVVARSRLRRAAPFGSLMYSGKVGQGPDFSQLIVAIAQEQDRSAFVQLFEFFAPRIKTFLMRRGASADAAEDLAQEAMLTVWRKAPFFDPTRASASAWIFAVARNLRIDSVRKDQRGARLAQYDTLEQVMPEEPDHILVSAQREERVRAAFAQLSEEQIRVVQLSFFEDRPHADIASALNIPLGTVKSRLRLAMTKLRDVLGDLK